MTHLTLQMLHKVIYVFKSEYLFVDKTSTKYRTRIESPVQHCFLVCTGSETPSNRWTRDKATCNQPERHGEKKIVVRRWN